MMGRLRSFPVAFYYAMLFGAVGVQLPFWPVWLADRGLSPAQIGLALALPYAGRTLFSPLMGWVADHLGQRQKPLLAVAAVTTLLWCGFGLVDGFEAILILSFVAAGLWSCLMPLGDVLALAAAAEYAFDYARARLWGSICFIALSLGSGWLLHDLPASWLLWLIVGMLALTTVAASRLPDLRPPLQERGAESFSSLLARPALRWFLLATALNQAAHTALYGFATLHWQQAGLDSTSIGFLWAEGVLSEIVLFLVAAPLTRNWKPESLLLIGLGGGVIRWTVLGLTTQVGWLVLFQVFHAATFGACHLGAMYFLQRNIPAGSTARAQGLYSALAAGLMPGLMLPITGKLFAAFDGGVFFLMALLSAAGALAAYRMGNVINLSFERMGK